MPSSVLERNVSKREGWKECLREGKWKEIRGINKTEKEKRDLLLDLITNQINTISGDFKKTEGEESLETCQQTNRAGKKRSKKGGSWQDPLHKPASL